MVELEAGTALRITGVGMFLFGCVGLVAAVRLRRQHPPHWVSAYRGRGSAGLGLIFGAAWLITGIAPTLDGIVPASVIVWLTRLNIACVLAFAVTSWFWYPRRLCPGWYRRARAAGVDVTSPAAVESFRQLPVPEQRRRAETRPAS